MVDENEAEKDCVSEVDPYLGTLQDDAETVETLKRVYPYFRIDPGRGDFVRQGNRFSNPQSAQAMSIDMAEGLLPQANIKDSPDVRREYRETVLSAFPAMYEQMKEEHPRWEEFGYWEEYQVSGCPEEPDAPLVHVVVRRLRESFAKGPYPTLLVIPGGGLYAADPMGFSSAPLSEYFGCQMVSMAYRTNIDGKYPAAVNDLHAVYQWMIQNADSLEIDTDHIVITGMSAGGLLAAALPFRLKRYDWCGGPMPRGVMVEDGFFDDRETTHSMRMLSKTWSGFNNRASNMLYMGENFASGFIGPEAYANHATVDECRGLCPFIIYEGQDNCGCDPALQFTLKLNEAEVFCSFYMCGGTTHVQPVRKEPRAMLFVNFNTPDKYEPLQGTDPAAQVENFIVGGIEELFKADLRREGNQ